MSPPLVIACARLRPSAFSDSSSAVSSANTPAPSACLSSVSGRSKTEIESTRPPPLLTASRTPLSMLFGSGPQETAPPGPPAQARSHELRIDLVEHPVASGQLRVRLG